MIEQRKIREKEEEEKFWLANSASGNLLYTYRQLTERDLDFFESLPITFRYEKEGYPAFTCCHGSPVNTRELLQLDSDRTKEVLEETILTICLQPIHIFRVSADIREKPI